MTVGAEVLAREPRPIESQPPLPEIEARIRQAHKMEAVGRLAGGVAHDFNNVLMIIGLHCEHLLASSRLDGSDREAIEAISTAAERAAALTRSLLSFSRQYIVPPTILDLNRLVSGVEPLLRPLTGAAVRFETRLDPGLWSVKAERSQLEQVLLNLTVNARDAMPDGGTLSIETTNVTLDATFASRHPGLTAGEYVRLTVKDTGVGMDPETLTHVFEPFFTTKGPGHGTGLGLATVYGIVKQSGGYVTMSSAPGCGTTAHVYLPRVQGPPAPQPSKPEPAGRSRAGGTLLVVEDEEEVRALMTEVLAEQGYRVLQAAHGDEALAVSRGFSGTIDLLVTDIVMPQIGGCQLGQALSAERPGLKVLYVSGYSADLMSQRSPVLPGSVVLQKPVSSAVLVQVVRQILG
jgi:nitrogen-specific signal transduction histidine kinase/CheY-like chemotaxis protein